MKLLHLENISSERIAHGDSKKKVFEQLGYNSNTFTQSAIGIMEANETCEEHFHESMIEIFYFISGKGFYTIEGLSHEVRGGTYLRIEPNERHSLIAVEKLTFFYLGIPIK